MIVYNDPFVWRVQPNIYIGPTRRIIGRGINHLILPLSNIPFDVINKQSLSVVNDTPTLEINKYGRGLQTDASQECAYFVGANREIISEGTIMWVGTFLGSASGFASFAGITFGDGAIDPYAVLELRRNYNGSDNLVLTYNNGGTPGSDVAIQDSTPAISGPYVIIGRVKTGAQSIVSNGVETVSNTLALSFIGYYTGSRSRLVIGESAAPRNPNVICNLLVTWRRFLSDAEVKQLTANPWIVFENMDALLKTPSAAPPSGYQSRMWHVFM